MADITSTWCPNCEEGHEHTDVLISTEFLAEKREHRGSGVWIMLKCKNCGIKHSAGFKMYKK